MTQRSRKSRAPTSREWTSAISALRHAFKLSQTSFGKRFHSSSMAVSRWERGAQEPTARRYIELGNLAGDPMLVFLGPRRTAPRRLDAGRATTAAKPLPE